MGVFYQHAVYDIPGVTGRSFHACGNRCTLRPIAESMVSSLCNLSKLHIHGRMRNSFLQVGDIIILFGAMDFL